MKKVIRYPIILIPKKLRAHLCLTFNDNIKNELFSTGNDTQYVNLNLYPTINLTIVREREKDENGQYINTPWNPNDNLGMTKFNFPIFMNEMIGMQKDLKIPKLYSYQGNRLELNEGEAEKIRRVFPIGNILVEISAVVINIINQEGNEDRVEGIKLKFNNERSSVLLTLNEIDSLIYNLYHTDMDSIGIMLYNRYNDQQMVEMSNYNIENTSRIDIKPLDPNRFSSPDDTLDDI